MKLNERPFQAIINGKKSIEIRLNDEKRQQIKLGDVIEFICVADTSKKLSVVVEGLAHFDKFRTMFSTLPPQLFGYTENDLDYLNSSIYEVYTPEEEDKYGALGIKFHIQP